MKRESPFYEQALEVMKSSALFSGLDTETLEAMLKNYERETWAKGSHLPPRQTVERFTVVISGRLELTRTNPETGRQITLFFAEPGDAFDVITLLDRVAHDIQPVAVDPVEVLTAPLQATRHWIELHPAFNSALLPYLGQRIRDLENLSTDLALSETVTRLAKLILLQATPEPQLADESPVHPPLINTLSDEAMARMIGSVRVVVNRHLQDLKRRGLITKDPGKLVVTNLEKLRQFCERLR